MENNLLYEVNKTKTVLNNLLVVLQPIFLFLLKLIYYFIIFHGLVEQFLDDIVSVVSKCI